MDPLHRSRLPFCKGCVEQATLEAEITPSNSIVSFVIFLPTNVHAKITKINTKLQVNFLKNKKVTCFFYNYKHLSLSVVV